MRFFYLVGALICIIIILIISFQNILAVCSQITIFFYELNTSIPPTLLIFGISILGMLAGGFLFGFLHSLFTGPKGDDEEDEEF